MVEERAASGRRVDVRHAGAGDRAGLRCGLLKHEGLKHGTEAQKRRKRDVHYLRQELGDEGRGGIKRWKGRDASKAREIRVCFL